MEDFIFKEGLVIVGVVIAAILLAFAYSALRESPLKEEIPSKAEGIQETLSAIRMSCRECLSDKFMNKDCNIIEVNLDKEIVWEDEKISLMAPSVQTPESLEPLKSLGIGKHILKTKNNEGACIAVKVA